MAGVQGVDLAVAVSRAGALGSLPAAMLTPDQLDRDLATLASTGLPYNVNFFAHRMPAPDPLADQRWRDALARYREEYAVPDEPGGPTRRPFDSDALDVLRRHRPPVVSFHFGLPEPNLLDGVLALGATVLSTATTVAEGRWLAERGVHGVIAQGWAAGGHRGHFLSADLNLQRPTTFLVADLVQTLDLPIVAAGGITTAADVAFMRGIGAAAVQCGTAFLLADEATTSPLQRAAINGSHATVVTTALTGRPARGIPNRLIHDLGYLPASAPPFPLAAGPLGALRAAAEAQGRTDFTPLWCGASTVGVRSAPAADIIADLLG